MAHGCRAVDSADNVDKNGGTLTDRARGARARWEQSTDERARGAGAINGQKRSSRQTGRFGRFDKDGAIFPDRKDIKLPV